ncbi:hypothetical protein C8R44DRAFT_759496 [Mycena epipterygia]|nr:hypothetical protein C8R44DRAFT_759496 [Mycena epipterygia]
MTDLCSATRRLRLSAPGLMNIEPALLLPSRDPVFPPEIADVIIRHLDSTPALRACSLVCRGWVPASRDRLHRSLFIGGRDIPKFIDIIGSPYNTYTNILETIDFVYCQSGPTDFILARLPEFSQLKTIKIQYTTLFRDIGPSPIPHITSLTISETHFPSFALFTDFLSRFPGLKTLKLELLNWDDDEEQAPASVPLHTQARRLELDTLSVDIPADPEFLTWLSSADSAPLARSLELQVTWIATTTESTMVTDVVSKYLRWLNVYLMHLRLDLRLLSDENLDYHSNTALQSLQIDNAIAYTRYYLEDAEDEDYAWELRVSHIVGPFLRQIQLSSLENLIIGVKFGDWDQPQPHPGTAEIGDFPAIFDIPRYTQLRSLQFTGSWEGECEYHPREDFTRQLIDELPSSAARVAVLIEASP